MNITGSAMVFHDNAYYKFGGDVDYEYSSTTARFDGLARNWSKVGDLEVARCCSAIYNDEFFMVIGCDAELNTELCSLQKSTISTNDFVHKTRAVHEYICLVCFVFS